MLSQLFRNCVQHGFTNSRIHEKKTEGIRQTISWTAQKTSFVLVFQKLHLENISIMVYQVYYKECLAFNSSHFLDVLRKKSKQKKNDVKIVSNWEFMLKIAQKLIWGETWPNLFLWHLDLNHVMWPTPPLPAFVSSSQRGEKYLWSRIWTCFFKTYLEFSVKIWSLFNEKSA